MARINVHRRLDPDFGDAPESARYAMSSHQEFPGKNSRRPNSILNAAHGSRRWRWVDALRQDLQFAARTLRKQPAFLAVAVLSLGFGIGATTTMFSVIEALDLRRLPFRDVDRLIAPQLVRKASDPFCPSCREAPFSAVFEVW